MHLLELGARVTLLDAWGPGNSRASSGGETRIFRAAYGRNQPYTEMAARALRLWRKYEKKWKQKFLHPCGVLWLANRKDDSYERGSLGPLREAKIRFEQLSGRDIARRWPQIHSKDIGWAILEPECGYLDARASCGAVVDAFVAQGGEYRQIAVLSDKLESAFRQIELADGSSLQADVYVFACGPWLGTLFPNLLGDLVRATKQEIYFFGLPERDAHLYTESHMPVWGDHHDRFYYGIPGSGRRGFKVADDTRGPDFEPTFGDRTISQEKLQSVREYLAHRFPRLKDAPLVESRVCQYEESPDGNFLIDRHPKAESVWFVGGGSGHGFKHGPALGEMMAKLILNDREPDAFWRISARRTAEKRK